MVPNIGIIVGTRGTFVVDTGLGNRNGQTVTREIQKVSKTPELYLATTHFHPEHDLGAGSRDRRSISRFQPGECRTSTGRGVPQGRRLIRS
jgi:glyoxylase-like metal-dependent hydrolase (beta-lactamase superfamily II)